MYQSTIEIDLHGKNVYQSRIALDAALRRAPAGTYRIRVIHGCNSGHAISDFIHDSYGDHPRVLRLEDQRGRGATDLVLREY